MFGGTAFLGLVALTLCSFLLLALAGEQVVVTAEKLSNAAIGEEAIAVGVPDGNGSGFIDAEAEANNDVGIAGMAGFTGPVKGSWKSL